jgi:hypothetical protein
LGEKLKQIYDARTVDKILYVKADKNLEYVKVIDALDNRGPGRCSRHWSHL